VPHVIKPVFPHRYIVKRRLVPALHGLSFQVSISSMHLFYLYKGIMRYTNSHAEYRAKHVDTDYIARSYIGGF